MQTIAARKQLQKLVKGEEWSLAEDFLQSLRGAHLNDEGLLFLATKIAFYQNKKMSLLSRGSIYLYRNAHERNGQIVRQWLRSVDVSQSKNPQRSNSKSRVDVVGDYYDSTAKDYLATYGQIVQAHRSYDINELLDLMMESAGLSENLKVIDAGAGFCGPAIHFAKKSGCSIDAITASKQQAEIAAKNIVSAGLKDQVSVTHGDFHELEEHFEIGVYDIVYFLESFGHSHDPKRAISAAFDMLKPGGRIYIKDFYKLKSEDSFVQNRIDDVIGNIDFHYKYQTKDLSETISILRSKGFLINFIRTMDIEIDSNEKESRAFEERRGFNYRGDESNPFMPAEWLEILCTKIPFENGKID